MSTADFLATMLSKSGRMALMSAQKLNISNEEAVRHAIRHMQAQRLGRPFYYGETRYEVTQPSSRRNCVALHENNLAYVRTPVGGGHEVAVRDLVTGDERTYCGEARENIKRIALTGRLLAFANEEGTLYVADFQEPGPPIRLLMPSANVMYLTADGDTVALIAAARRATYLWSCRTKRLHVCPFATQTAQGQDSAGRYDVPLLSCTLRVDAETGTLDVFSDYRGNGPLDGSKVADPDGDPPNMFYCIGHMRFDISGNYSTTVPLTPICSSILEFQTGQKAYIFLTGLQSIDMDGSYRMQIDTYDTPSRRPSTDREWSQNKSIIFDSKSAEMRLERHHLPFPAVTPDFKKEFIFSGRLLRWKNGYHSVFSDAEALTTFSEVGDGTEGPKKQMKYQGTLSLYERAKPGGRRSLAAFMNDQYLVVSAENTHTQIPGQARVLVICFDESAKLAGGHLTGFWPSQGKESRSPLDRTSTEHLVIRYWPARDHVLPFEQLG
ncbi:hypothetical protein LTR56_027063 [Elasticomyces elasticus]|nr:hypothetical protein LTR56_027063 [Elasticomyces elasticus]KAK3628647.1 hypothetical protein LTR22_022276 [Elasticomyces elasticus]KAK4907790.1 hypothetical protein LTR49_023254 [Elasticomyces elasticus]KAK5747001.1 hypothetical protein LTS12_022570 [Elasticomyces elasticus]